MSKQGRCNSCCNNDCSCWMKCCGGEDKSVNRDENGDNYNCVNRYSCVETVEKINYGVESILLEAPQYISLNGSMPHNWINGISTHMSGVINEFTLEPDLSVRVIGSADLILSKLGIPIIVIPGEGLDGEYIPPNWNNGTFLPDSLIDGGENLDLRVMAFCTVDSVTYGATIGQIDTDIDTVITHSSFKELKLVNTKRYSNNDCINLMIWRGDYEQNELPCNASPTIEIKIVAIVETQRMNDVDSMNLPYIVTGASLDTYIECLNVSGIQAGIYPISSPYYYPYIGRLLNNAIGSTYKVPSAPYGWYGNITYNLTFETTKNSYLGSLLLGNKGECQRDIQCSENVIRHTSEWYPTNLRCPVKDISCEEEYDGNSWGDLLYSFEDNGEFKLDDINNSKLLYVDWQSGEGSLLNEPPSTASPAIINFFERMKQNYATGSCSDLKIYTDDKIEIADIGFLRVKNNGEGLYIRRKFYALKEYNDKTDIDLGNDCNGKKNEINGTCTSCSSIWLDEIGYVDRTLYVSILALNVAFEFVIYYHDGYWSSKLTTCYYPDSITENGNIAYQSDNVRLDIVGRNCVLDVKSITSEYDPFFGTVPPLPLNIVFTLPQKQCVYHIGDVVITQDSFKSPLFVRGYPAIVYITGTGTEVTYAQ